MEVLRRRTRKRSRTSCKYNTIKYLEIGYMEGLLGDPNWRCPSIQASNLLSMITKRDIRKFLRRYRHRLPGKRLFEVGYEGSTLRQGTGRFWFVLDAQVQKYFRSLPPLHVWEDRGLLKVSRRKLGHR